MIYVTVKEKKQNIKELKIEGHAEYGENGKDLVCAGVSSIGVGLLNALDEKQKDVELNMDDALIKIKVNNMNDSEIQLMLYVAITQLKTINERYPNYIRIEKE